MKKYLVPLFFFLTASSTFLLAKPQPEAAHCVSEHQTDQDSTLHHIEKKIMDAFVQSMARSSAAPLNNLSKQLAEGYQQTQQGLFLYWQAYTLFYTAIYHAETNDKGTAEIKTDQAISLLISNPRMSSEDYALLAFLQGFSIPFKSSMKAPFISARSAKNARKALAMDPYNARAYYVLGSNDYYTPKQFGGGKEVVDHLEKALELCAKQTPNPYLPSWGAEHAFELLLRFYSKEENEKELQATIQRVQKDFPDSYRLHQIIREVKP